MGVGSSAPLGVDVAIVAYRRWDLTSSCLDHLASQTREHRVVVCDNGCDEGTADLVREHYPDVEVLRLERNMPYATACNRAVAQGERDVIVMMNNDIDARPDFLERLVAPLESDPTVGSVSGLLIAPGEQRIDSVGLVADRTLSAFPRWGGAHPSQARADSPVLTGPAGAAAAFRRAAWDEVGGLDQRIFAYMEDFDLAVRLRTAGWGAGAALDAVAVHIGSATNVHRSVNQRRNGGFGRGYVLRRYGLLRTRLAAQILATEAIVVLADVVISRDLAALKGRIAGWRAGRGLPRHAMPPAAAVDGTITFRDSMRLRRGVYFPGQDSS
ncbi:glycosyltransferase [Patulibacter sp.]|uniref:glycosyltransferase n=1 Tax=Patulibacter sp. TaxID=1912859 RepID=UPI002716897B|nr:glycosyltransferase [Patulibacter sp.]MDO9408193.1 glycosyltransferase [Patulibacter sp.]